MISISLECLQRKMKESVKGQNEVVDRLCIDFMKYLIRCHGRDYGIYFDSPLVILLCGKSGNGKTYTMKTLARLQGIPFYQINCKSIAQEGWHGTSFLQHLDRAGFDNRGIVFLDEFDKIIEPLASDARENVNKHIQSSLLKYIEGDGGTSTKYEFGRTVFVLAGAFEALYAHQDKTVIGFSKDTTKHTFSLKDFINVGLLPEFAGRISQYYFLNELSDDILEELMDSDKFIIQKYLTLLNKLDISLELNKEELIKAFRESKLGVRGLIQEVERQVTECLLKNSDKINLEKFSPLHIEQEQEQEEFTKNPISRAYKILKIKDGNSE